MTSISTCQSKLLWSVAQADVRSSQILSVHRPAGLHPNLAIVQRGSGFADFVLAETGQMVGLEDEGVVELWQGLLGCNAEGKPDESGQKAFWKGWESRLLFMPVV